MYLSHFADGARRAAIARNRILKTGYVFGGQKVWSEAEDRVCRLFYPSISTMDGLLRSRSRAAIQRRCQILGLSPARHEWTNPAVNRLRRLYPSASWPDLFAAFPGLTKTQISQAATYRGFRRDRKRYKSTGHAVLDQLRDRAYDCNMFMRDCDAMARTRCYFYKARWHSGRVNYDAIAKAARGLDGRLLIQWDVSD